jgi:hypothetical protein
MTFLDKIFVQFQLELIEIQGDITDMAKVRPAGSPLIFL